MIAQRPPPTIATREFTAGNPGNFGGLSSTVAIQAVAPTTPAQTAQTVAPGTVGDLIAVYAATTTLTVPPVALGTAQFVNQSIPLVGFPTNYRLASGQSATVFVSVALQLPGSFAPAFPIATLPYVSLTLTAGITPTGATPYTLVGPSLFQGFALNITVPFFSATAVGASTAPLAVWAALVGPASQ